MEWDLEELLGFLPPPQPTGRQSAPPTNVIERAFSEVRRRTWRMSSSTNLASCDRFVIGVISHLNGSRERKPLKQFTQNP